jgi:hypothetical protein
MTYEGSAATIQNLKELAEEALDEHLRPIAERKAEQEIARQLIALFCEESMFEYLVPLYLTFPEHTDDESNEEYDAKEDAAAKPFEDAKEAIRGALRKIKSERPKNLALTACGLECGPDTADALYNAAVLLHGDFEFDARKRDVVFAESLPIRAEYCSQFKQQALDWEKAASPADETLKKRMRDKEIFAVAMMTFKYRPVEAHAFWEGISLGTNLPAGDPRHTYLCRYLYNWGRNQKRRGAAAIYTTLAWNAFVEGRELPHLRIPKNYKIAISGTPLAK